MKVYNAEYMDDGFECFEAINDAEAVERARALEEEQGYGVLTNVFEVDPDDNYEATRTVF